MKKALFWDFDGTLVYPDAKWSVSLYESLKYFGYNIERETVRQYMRMGYTWHNPEVAYISNTGQKWWDNFFSHLEPFYQSHTILKADAEKINADFKQRILNAELYTLYEDAEPTLCKCLEMGYKNYVLSNNFPELTHIIKDLGLAEYFTDYVVSANIGYEKPRIEIFEYALNLAGFPDICYMIGDNPVADMQGGKSVGMKTFLVHSDVSSDADYVCKDLSEIPFLLI